MHPLETFHFCPKCGAKKFEIKDAGSKKCAVCGFWYYANASAAVTPFILDGNDNLICTLRKEDPGKGKMDLPGGFVDIGERIEDALIRETKEELNIDITDAKFLFSFPNVYAFGGYTQHPIDLFFECKAKDLSTLKAGDDVSEIILIKKSEINPQDFVFESSRNAVKAWLAIKK